MWVGLRRDKSTNTYTWEDGILYDAAVGNIPNNDGHARYMISKNDQFDDAKKLSNAPYICQADLGDTGLWWKCHRDKYQKP